MRTAIYSTVQWRGSLDQEQEALQHGDPPAFEIVTRPEYRLPSLIPDGGYSGTPLTIEPYEHQ